MGICNKFPFYFKKINGRNVSITLDNINNEIQFESNPKVTKSVAEITKILQDAGVSPSIQRIKILQFIFANVVHSSVEKIYHELVTEIPTLSKTTVYNTLGLFIEKGIINSITIDNTEILYEQSLKPHAHFLCEVCKSIIDIDINDSLFSIKEINGHQVKKVDIHLKGICNKCLNN